MDTEEDNEHKNQNGILLNAQVTNDDETSIGLFTTNDEHTTKKPAKRKGEDELTDQEIKSFLWKSYTVNINSKEIIDLPKLGPTKELDKLKFNDVAAKLRQCNDAMKKLNCKTLINAYSFGCRLNLAFCKYKFAQKHDKTLPATWEKFLKKNVSFSSKMCYEYRVFSERFHTFPKMFKCGLPFHFFKGKQGQRIANLLNENG